VRQAVVSGRDALSREKVEHAFLEQSLSLLDAAVAPALSRMQETLLARLPQVLGRTLAAAGGAAVSTSGLRASAAFELSFDSTNPSAKAWAARSAAEMVVKVSKQTRLAVRKIITQSFEKHYTAQHSTRLLESVLGLTDEYADAVLALRERLVNAEAGQVVFAGKTAIRVPKTVSQAFLEGKVKAYADRLLRHRASNVARTETMAASNEGQRLSWLQGVQTGSLDEGVQRIWLEAKDQRLCQICRAMHGKTVGLTERFVLPDGTKVLGPPAHPSCRCGQGLTEGRRLQRFSSLGQLYTAASSLGISYKGGTPEYHREYNRLKRQKGKGATVPSSGPDGLPLIDTANMVQIGGKAGSNPGGLYQAADGTKWYVKKGKSEDHVASEVLAGKLYAEAGVAVPETRFAQHEGAPGIASRIVPTEKVPSGELSGLAGTAEGFAADAWLANWDVVGLDFDNLSKSNGKAMRLDAGGALEFRAQGGKKGSAFGNEVLELKTLRDPHLNPQAAKVFGKLTPAQINASIDKVVAISDSRIRELVSKYYASNPKLADKLIARKQSLASQKSPLGNSVYTATEDIGVKKILRTAVSSLGIPFKGGTPEYHKAYNKLMYEKKKVSKKAVVGDNILFNPTTKQFSVSPSGQTIPQGFELFEKVQAPKPKPTAAPGPIPATQSPMPITPQKPLGTQQKHEAAPIPEEDDPAFAALPPIEGPRPKTYVNPQTGQTTQVLPVDKPPAGFVPAPPPSAKLSSIPPPPPGSMGFDPKLAKRLDQETLALKLSENEKAAVTYYSGSGYAEMNTLLRDPAKFHAHYTGGQPAAVAQSYQAKIAARTETLQKAIDRAPVRKEPIVSWRGQQGAFPGKEGEVFELKGFQSTTINPHTATNFGGFNILEFHTKKGLYLGNQSQHASEKELLLNHGTKVRFLRKEKRTFRILKKPQSKYGKAAYWDTFTREVTVLEVL
jgi:hypothetical protein